MAWEANVEHSHKVGRLTKYVCRGCHSVKQGKYICVYCKRGVKNMCICFNENYYDLSKYIVHKCIGNVNISRGPHYICVNCHKSLLPPNDDYLLVPYHVNKGSQDRSLFSCYPQRNSRIYLYMLSLVTVSKNCQAISHF